MLVSLHVKNMALIVEEEVEFGPGLNILTGETGAGKSMIIGSINVALGREKFTGYFPEGAEYALCELIFETEDPKVLEKLKQMDIPVEDGTIIISRKFQKKRSISRVNGESVPISFVKELAGLLIDIHGQHQHQSLLDPRFHLELLDRYVGEGFGDLRERYAESFSAYTQAERLLEQAGVDAGEKTKQLDLIHYELDEIQSAALTEGEDERLEEEFRRMENGQKIMDALSHVQQHLEEGGLSDALSRASRELLTVSAYDQPLEELAAQLATIEDLVSEFGRSLSDYIDDFSYDEKHFYEVSTRLDTINHLKTKYGGSIASVLHYQEELEEKLDRLEHQEEYIAGLQKKAEKAKKSMLALAGEISAVRSTYAQKLEQEITQALIDLNFLDVRFTASCTALDKCSANGRDALCFMISTNPGQPIRPLQEVASGGELSRIMLAIKSVMADQDEIGTLIFDEIDTGISGRTAQKVAERMAVIAMGHQVICITHLAQIAAMADSHYLIDKRVDAGHTVTTVRPLTGGDETVELARILGGVSITDSVIASAREMKQLAEGYKSSLHQS